MARKTLVIACKVLKHQIEQLGPIPHDIVYVEQGLHRTPQKLKHELQQIIDGSSEYDDLLLGYGLCYIKNYKRTVFINTSPNDTQEAKDYARNFAAFFNLEYAEMEGSLDYLRKLIFGPWDEDFVILTDGQSPEDEMFQDR